MTREHALKVLDTIPTIGDQVDALEMAISALKNEDAVIDRVLEIIDRLDAEAAEDFELDTDYGLAVVHDRFARARKKIKALNGNISAGRGLHTEEEEK